MRAGGRICCAGGAGAGIIPRLLCFFISIQISASSEYGVPIEIKIWDSGRSPLSHMVDVTNGFGLKVLAEHNFLNENNIAFSPYGLMGILVALYEGVDGESSYQMQHAMPLPWNRNVMRIGFRDIHRTLKTYFVPEEGFLAGLALNNENVTFNEAYKKILRFYGFDLNNNEQLPTLAPTNGTNGTEATSAAPSADPMATVPAATTMTPTTREETTPTPNAETLSDVDIRGPSTSSPSSAPNAESTTGSTQPLTDRTEQTPATTTESTDTSTSTLAPSTNAEEATSDVTSVAQTNTEPTLPQSSSSAMSEEPTTLNEVDTTSSMSSTSTTDDTTQTEQTTESSSSTMNTLSTLASTTAAGDTTLETLERRKRSNVVDFIFMNPPYVDDYLIHRSYDIPIPSRPDPSEPNFEGNKIFLANGLRNVQVTYMHYDAILEHAYLPHLDASALRLPLDSDRYYLLVVLPSKPGAVELGRLLARMARESDLSDVCAELRPRRVRAIVPSFTVKGHVILTTDLQKLGIRDVFEPRQRDFTPMTHQAGVYVRSIEQAVSVVIRKYREPDSANTNNTSNRYVSNRYPISFLATYPFLYFVMDSTIHVALMAGKMVDPLNSRIL